MQAKIWAYADTNIIVDEIKKAILSFFLYFIIIFSCLFVSISIYLFTICIVIFKPSHSYMAKTYLIVPNDFSKAKSFIF